MIKKIYIIFACIFFLTGCSLIDSDLNKVESPTMSKTPINGKWTVSKTIFKEDLKEKTFIYKDYIGKNAIFSNNGVIIGDSYSKNPRYKAKRVPADKYLKEKYNVSKSLLSIDSDYIYVVQIFDSDEIFYEIMRTSEDKAYIYINGVFLLLNKSSSEVNEDELNSIINQKQSKENSISQNEDEDASENGFLLGLKYTENENKGFNYKTLYFKFDDEKISNIKEIKNLIIPKQNKYLEISVERENSREGINDNIILKEVGSEEKTNKIGEHPVIYSTKEINFLSDNYINYLEKHTKEENTQCLKLFYLNAPEGSKQISLSDIIKNGDQIYKEYAIRAKNGDKAGFYNDSNIGFKRYNGYWKLIGNVSFVEEDKDPAEIDFNSLLPKNFYKNSNLIISMKEVKSTFPNVEDIFITPNNKFLITLENNQILIYNIKNGKIIDKVVNRIDIPKNSKVVMSQYAIGRNSEIWEKQLSIEK